MDKVGASGKRAFSQPAAPEPPGRAWLGAASPGKVLPALRVAVRRTEPSAPSCPDGWALALVQERPELNEPLFNILSHLHRAILAVLGLRQLLFS